MKPRYILLIGCLSFYLCRAVVKQDVWQPSLTDQEMAIKPKTHETAYQYAARKVNEMIKKYPKRRIVGSFWLSEYWKHHYYGALEWRNYYWTYN